jgi:hypothetical protein
MSTTAIVILVAIGLVIMMQLNGRARDQEDSAPPDKGSSLAGYIAAMGVVLGITVLLVRACQGSF